MRKKYNLFLWLLAIVLLTQGCFIFRPKNRCDTCPHWSKGGGH